MDFYVVFTRPRYSQMRRRLCRARASCTSGCTSCPSRFGSPRWTGWPRCWSSCPRTPPHTTGYIMVEWVRCCQIRNNYSGSGYEVLEFRIRILTMLLKHIWIFFVLYQEESTNYLPFYILVQLYRTMGQNPESKNFLSFILAGSGSRTNNSGSGK